MMINRTIICKAQKELFEKLEEDTQEHWSIDSGSEGLSSEDYVI